MLRHTSSAKVAKADSPGNPRPGGLRPRRARSRGGRRTARGGACRSPSSEYVKQSPGPMIGPGDLGALGLRCGSGVADFGPSGEEALREVPDQPEEPEGDEDEPDGFADAAETAPPRWRRGPGTGFPGPGSAVVAPAGLQRRFALVASRRRPPMRRRPSEARPGPAPTAPRARGPARCAGRGTRRRRRPRRPASRAPRRAARRSSSCRCAGVPMRAGRASRCPSHGRQGSREPSPRRTPSGHGRVEYRRRGRAPARDLRPGGVVTPRAVGRRGCSPPRRLPRSDRWLDQPPDALPPLAPVGRSTTVMRPPYIPIEHE